MRTIGAEEVWGDVSCWRIFCTIVEALASVGNPRWSMLMY